MRTFAAIAISLTLLVAQTELLRSISVCCLFAFDRMSPRS